MSYRIVGKGKQMKKNKHILSAERVPFSPEIGKLPSIRITAERKVDYVELDLDMDDEAVAVLAEAGWEAIRKDRDALVSYAITKALTDLVKNEKEKDARHIA
jgi:ATP-dependent 26S proteasome regulatory subunit